MHDRHEIQLTRIPFWQIAKQQQKFCNTPLKVDNMRVYGFLIYKLYYMDSPFIHKAIKETKGKFKFSKPDFSVELLTVNIKDVFHITIRGQCMYR